MSLDLSEELKNIQKEKQYTIPVFIPHLGCNNDCVFCNQRKISGKLSSPTEEEVDKNIVEHLGYLTDKTRKVQIAFFGGSFTGLNLSHQIMYLKTAYKYIESGNVDSLRLSTRPDYISPTILKLLKKYGVETIELGVQSMDKDVLKVSKRGHSDIQVIRAAKLITSFGFKLGFQIMLGLPESNLNKEISTIDRLLKLKPNELRIYPVYVIEQSELFDMYNRHEYVPLELDDAIFRAYNVMKACQKSDIKIIRIGLQSTDEITQNNSKVIGPVCDNFAEYVVARLIRDKLDNMISELIEEKREIRYLILYVNKRVPISMVIGPKRVNQKYIEQKYNIKISVKNKEN